MERFTLESGEQRNSRSALVRSFKPFVQPSVQNPLQCLCSASHCGRRQGRGSQQQLGPGPKLVFDPAQPSLEALWEKAQVLLPTTEAAVLSLRFGIRCCLSASFGTDHSWRAIPTVRAIYLRRVAAKSECRSALSIGDCCRVVPGVRRLGGNP